MSSIKDTSPTPHIDVVRAHWRELTAYRSKQRVPLIDGHELTLAGVVASSRFRVVPQLDGSAPVRARVQASADFAKTFVAGTVGNANASMYGVTTGFGGSGNTRVKEAPKLQQVLIKGLQAGIIPPPAKNLPDLAPGAPVIPYNQQEKDEQDLQALGVESLLMPESWTKGALTIRLNSLIRGHSGCRYEVLTALHQLLVKNITPCPPLRMTVSASGDLGPLAYIAGAVTGEGKALVWAGEGAARTRIPAPLALQQHNLCPLPFHPKEGLAIVNGTAPSCSAASAALHDAHFVFLLGQALTALCVEALNGTLESFVPFLHDIARAHPGQIEVAANIRRALQGSGLVVEHDEGDPEHRLRQDRYSLRTAPQWLGPQIEEALSAHYTITQEMNATTDNPIIDARPPAERGANEPWSGNLCGGNFQGTSLTVALEKLRVGLQHVGRIAYSQIVELGQPSMNRGLAPDLAASEPSLDYGQKALDLAASSYLAELSFVSNTVSNHVQAAEMHNQSINSLALVAARYTATAVQLVQMILANELFSLCQAVDLRAIYAPFFATMRTHIVEAVKAHVQPSLSAEDAEALVKLLYAQARVSFGQTSTLDTAERFPTLVRPLLADVFTFLHAPTRASTTYTFSAAAFHTTLARACSATWLANRDAYFARENGSGSAAPLLGRTQYLYEWVRGTLGVPMRMGIDVDREETDAQVSRIYEGIVRGDVNGVLLDVFAEQAV
ncbi:phenylalanine ammonia-lyase [Ramaria rubella]|nr:phenylalanine ammonia-lyase [Ramaria rubella]